MSFLGFERPDGAVGVRNYVVAFSSGPCVNDILSRIATEVEGVVPILHRHACVYLKRDDEMAARTLTGVGLNPNVASTLLVGVGCESVPLDERITGFDLGTVLDKERRSVSDGIALLLPLALVLDDDLAVVAHRVHLVLGDAPDDPGAGPLRRQVGVRSDRVPWETVASGREARQSQ